MGDPGSGENGLSADQVRRVALLSRLALPEEDVERYRAQLGQILAYAERLRALDLEDVQPLTHPLDASTRLGEDEPGPTLAHDVLMRLAPETAPPFIKVPRVLGEREA